jgi:hypothetical protein
MRTSAEHRARRQRRISCRRVRAALVEHLEDQLPADDQDRLTAHLQSCPRCAAERTALEKTLSLLGRRELPEPDERFWMELKGRVREGLREDRTSRRQPSPVPARTWAPAVAVAAAVVFLFLWWVHQPLPPAPGRDGMLSRMELEGRQSLIALGQSPDAAEALPAHSSPGDSLSSLLAAAARPSQILEKALIGTKMTQRPDLWGSVIEEEIYTQRPVEELLGELSPAGLRKLSARLSRLAG